MDISEIPTGSSGFEEEKRVVVYVKVETGVDDRERDCILIWKAFRKKDGELVESQYPDSYPYSFNDEGKLRRNCTFGRFVNDFLNKVELPDTEELGVFPDKWTDLEGITFLEKKAVLVFGKDDSGDDIITRKWCPIRLIDTGE